MSSYVVCSGLGCTPKRIRPGAGGAARACSAAPTDTRNILAAAAAPTPLMKPRRDTGIGPSCVKKRRGCARVPVDKPAARELGVSPTEVALDRIPERARPHDPQRGFL